MGSLVRLLVLLVCAETVFGQSADQHLSPRVRSEIEALVSKFMASTHVPGVSIAVVEKGKLLWATGFVAKQILRVVPGVYSSQKQ